MSQRSPFLVLLALVAAGLACRMGSRDAIDCECASRSPVQSLEMRLAQDEPSDGAQRAAVRGRQKSVYLTSDPVVTLADLRRAEVVRDQDVGVLLALWPTDDAARRLEEATSRNVGKKLAVVLDGEVVQAGTIQRGFGSCVHVFGSLTEEEMCRVSCSSPPDASAVE